MSLKNMLITGILVTATVFIAALAGCKQDVEEKYYTVTFSANGGSGVGPAVQRVTSGSEIVLPSEGGLTKIGYAFGGWNTSADGEGINYDASNSLNADITLYTFYTVTADITLYAKWIILYTVTFNANGGSGTVPALKTVTSGSTVRLPDQGGLTRPAYIFDGWNTDADGADDNYPVGSSFTPTSNITLYAMWAAAPPFDSVTGLANQLAWLEANAQSNSSYILEVNTDVNISPHTLSYSGRTNISIRLISTGEERVIGLSSNGSLFRVGTGAVLILDSGITLRGRDDNIFSLIRIDSGGTLLMNAGSAVIGNSFVFGGGGVLCRGTFIMLGGEISGNTSSSGGGVYVTGIFTMAGGEISGNTAINQGGGVYVSSSGTFTKTGGTIYGFNEGGSSNTVTEGINGNDRGHAVYVGSDPAKRRENTAGPWVTLDSITSANWE